jgi:hypothetical protein
LPLLPPVALWRSFSRLLGAEGSATVAVQLVMVVVVAVLLLPRQHRSRRKLAVWSGAEAATLRTRKRRRTTERPSHPG